MIDVSGLGLATEKNGVESRLGRQPGVVDIDAKPVTQTATAVFTRLQNGGARVAMDGDGVFVPIIDLGLRPEIAASTVSGSSIIVAFDAVPLKRLHLPGREDPAPQALAPNR